MVARLELANGRGFNSRARVLTPPRLRLGRETIKKKIDGGSGTRALDRSVCAFSRWTLREMERGMICNEADQFRADTSSRENVYHSRA